MPSSGTCSSVRARTCLLARKPGAADAPRSCLAAPFTVGTPRALLTQAAQRLPPRAHRTVNYQGISASWCLANLAADVLYPLLALPHCMQPLGSAAVRAMKRDLRKPKRSRDMRNLFRRLAERTAHAVGSPWAFLLALLTIAVWGVTGPCFKYSDTWQLFINTGTTIVTFLMVFLIQNTQNRETRIVALKLDELLRGVEGARTGLVQLDHMSDAELEIVPTGVHADARQVRTPDRRRPGSCGTRVGGAQATQLTCTTGRRIPNFTAPARGGRWWRPQPWPASCRRRPRAAGT